MKHYALCVMTLFIISCSDNGSNDIAQETGLVADDVTLCSCANETIDSDAKARACAALIESMSPEDAAAGTAACRENMAAPADGPDICFCLKTFSQDPGILKACDALISDDLSPRELNAMMLECAD